MKFGKDLGLLFVFKLMMKYYSEQLKIGTYFHIHLMWNVFLPISKSFKQYAISLSLLKVT
jgi:hypothetical protein